MRGDTISSHNTVGKTKKGCFFLSQKGGGEGEPAARRQNSGEKEAAPHEVNVLEGVKEGTSSPGAQEREGVKESFALVGGPLRFPPRIWMGEGTKRTEIFNTDVGRKEGRGGGGCSFISSKFLSHTALGERELEGRCPGYPTPFQERRTGKEGSHHGQRGWGRRH